MTQQGRIRIEDIVVVEGIHDKQVVLQVVDADIWVIGGNRIAHRFLEELRRASLLRGVLVMTDPDGPGEQIRKRIEQAIPGCKHAFLPKKSATSPSGVGVEHASPTDILAALTKARTSHSEAGHSDPEFTLQDMVEARLVNHAQAAARRQAVADVLRIGYANAKSFLRKLNALRVSREEWQQALQIVDGDERES
jgi:ribonuclease M5